MVTGMSCSFHWRSYSNEAKQVLVIGKSKSFPHDVCHKFVPTQGHGPIPQQIRTQKKIGKGSSSRCALLDHRNNIMLFHD